MLASQIAGLNLGALLLLDTKRFSLETNKSGWLPEEVCWYCTS